MNTLTTFQQDALRKLNIDALNTMQMAALAHCRANSSMVLLSPTGTGKTLAFLLPLLERLDQRRSGVQAVIVLPSRELARQVFEVWRVMATPFQMTKMPQMPRMHHFKTPLPRISQCSHFIQFIYKPP